MSPQPWDRNAFFAELSPSDYDLFRPHLTGFKLGRGERLQDFGQSIDYVVFPHDGVVAMTMPVRDGGGGAILVGRDSIVGGVSCAIYGFPPSGSFGAPRQLRRPFGKGRDRGIGRERADQRLLRRPKAKVCAAGRPNANETRKAFPARYLPVCGIKPWPRTGASRARSEVVARRIVRAALALVGLAFGRGPVFFIQSALQQLANRSCARGDSSVQTKFVDGGDFLGRQDDVDALCSRSAHWVDLPI
jgi:hypothetical protein